MDEHHVFESVEGGHRVTVETIADETGGVVRRNDGVTVIAMDFRDPDEPNGTIAITGEGLNFGEAANAFFSAWQSRALGMLGVLAAVQSERLVQDAKWGRQRHTWPEWMTILGEEYGEAQRDANHAYWGQDDPGLRDEVVLANLRTELVQTAAVAVAIIEHIDEIQAEEKGGAE